MDELSIARELDQPGAQALLQSDEPARLAYTGTDGLPRVIPIGFTWDGVAVVVTTAVTSPKVTALVAQPDVALSFDAGITPETARFLSIRGRASVKLIDDAGSGAGERGGAVLDADALAAIRAGVDDRHPPYVRITIPPGWVRFYDFGSKRFPAFLSRMDDGGS